MLSKAMTTPKIQDPMLSSEPTVRGQLPSGKLTRSR